MSVSGDHPLTCDCCPAERAAADPREDGRAVAAGFRKAAGRAAAGAEAPTPTEAWEAAAAGAVDPIRAAEAGGTRGGRDSALPSRARPRT